MLADIVSIYIAPVQVVRLLWLLAEAFRSIGDWFSLRWRDLPGLALTIRGDGVERLVSARCTWLFGTRS